MIMKHLISFPSHGLASRDVFILDTEFWILDSMSTGRYHV